MACWHGVNSFGTAWIAQQLSIKYLTPTGTTGAHRQEEWSVIPTSRGLRPTLGDVPPH